jgi:hypothetical protein
MVLLIYHNTISRGDVRRLIEETKQNSPKDCFGPEDTFRNEGLEDTSSWRFSRSESCERCHRGYVHYSQGFWAEST